MLNEKDILKKDTLKKDKLNRQCYDILQPLGSLPGKSNCADRNYEGPQEVIYAGKTRFSGVMDDLAMGFIGS